MKLAARNGAEISFYDVGKGSPLVFLHSFGHTKLMWFPQLQYFANCGFRVIAPDYRGCGESSFDPNREYTIDSLADDVAFLLDNLNLDKVTLIGISMGGYIAFSLWEKHPELIGSLVLSNTKAESDTEEIKARRASQIQYLKDHSLHDFVESGAPRRLSPKTIEKRPWVVDTVKMLNLSVKSEVLIAMLRAMMEKRDNSNLFLGINVPTLITAGADDAHIPKESAPAMNRGIKGSELVYIEETGHVSSLENAPQYNQALYEFLRKSSRENNQ